MIGAVVVAWIKGDRISNLLVPKSPEDQTGAAEAGVASAEVKSSADGKSNTSTVAVKNRTSS
jgi:hypothetical protein